MDYVTEEYMNELHSLLVKNGVQVERSEFPDINNIELGLEREFDSAIFFAIEENNEDRTMHLFSEVLEDGTYEDLVQHMLSMVDPTFRSFKTTSEFISGAEKVTVDTGSKNYEWTFDNDYFDENKLITYIASLINEISSNRIVKVLDEDCTFLMSLPLEAANLLDNKFQTIVVYK
jgi:hypothetical protein